jgi:glycosyltransferase involved in cell wall biosynthesis
VAVMNEREPAQSAHHLTSRAIDTPRLPMDRPRGGLTQGCDPSPVRVRGSAFGYPFAVPAPGRTDPRIGVLIVAYNAASSLANVLDRIPIEFRARISKVLVFDDHSQDSTYLVGLGYQQLARDMPLEVIRHPRNLGYGGNQKAGYWRAIELELDIIVLLHGDGQYAPELLPDMVKPLANGESDAVFGSRMLVKGAAREGGMPIYKFVGNRILTSFENATIGTKLSEFHSGYRAYSVDALRRLDFESYSDGFDFDTEIIIGLVDRGLTIKEIPIPTYYGDEICYVNGMRYAKDVTKDVVRYRIQKAGLGRSKPGSPPIEYSLKESVDGSHQAIVEWMDRPPCRVLDVGCSSGRLSERMRDLGHYVVGIDLLDHEGVKERTDEFHRANLDEGLPPSLEGQFDVIVCGDVLEHVRRPEALLNELGSRIDQRGRLIASVPNFGHWYPRMRTTIGRFDYDQRGILDEDHVRFFTRRSFQSLCARTKWTVVRRRTTGVPVELLANGRLARAAETVERGARSVWPTLFAYQLLYELRRNVS